MRPTSGLLIILHFSISLVAGAAAAQPTNGYVGIYSDSAGTQPCATVAPMSGGLLYVIATLEGNSASGITGAEFRIEVSDPDGWWMVYLPIDADVLFGDPLDTGDGAGVSFAFNTCQTPNAEGKLLLATIGVINFSGAPTTLFVKRHSNPTNSSFFCPLFTLCDSIFSKQCMSPSTAPECSLTTSKALTMTAAADMPVFSAGLNSTGDGRGPGDPSVARQDAAMEKRFTAVPQQTPDIVELPSAQKISTASSEADWFVEWTFEGGGLCNDSGWEAFDNRILNDGNTYWTVDSSFDGIGNVTLNAIVLTSVSSCWVLTDGGYGNDWYQGLRIFYSGETDLAFDYLIDSSPEDFLVVEVDSACSSFERVDYQTAPSVGAFAYRDTVFTQAGHKTDGFFYKPLDDFGTSETHCVYISFFSNFAISPQDDYTDVNNEQFSLVSSTGLRAGLVIDNIAISGDLAFVEDFESGSHPSVVGMNMFDSEQFGTWARTFPHITDNDTCVENTTCALLFTDYETPTIANDPSMAFGPSQYVVRNWLDNVIVSPWVSLPVSSSLKGTLLQFQEFPGNKFAQSFIARGYGVRGRTLADGCITSWSDNGVVGNQWEALDSFSWKTKDRLLTPFVKNSWDEVQIRFRLVDWRVLTGSIVIPDPFLPGPGPYIDSVRLGRIPGDGPVLLSGPAEADDRWQAQDTFPTKRNPAIPDGPLGPYYRPATDSKARFGTCAVSMGQDLGSLAPGPFSPNLITGDSIVVRMFDGNTRGIVRAGIFYCVAEGPHAGRKVPIERIDSTIFANAGPGCFVNYVDWSTNPRVVQSIGEAFDDEYFIPGDVLRYFWYAMDDNGTVRSAPPGVTVDPVQNALTLDQAEAATGGLFEVNFLPKMQWDSDLLAAIAADPVGKIDPKSGPTEGPDSWYDEFNGDPGEQTTCLLYVNKVNTGRRSTDLNRTSFMYTLDKLGYRDRYDVYDVQGFGVGDTNNDLGGRATTGQARGYAAIVHDAGRSSFVPIPDGNPANIVTRKIDQAGWYRTWLAEAGQHTLDAAVLWVIGENTVEDIPLNPLISSEMAVELAFDNQDQGANPGALAQDVTVNFNHGVLEMTTPEDDYTLSGGCPTVRDFDDLTTGTGTITHRFANPGSPEAQPTVGGAAVIVNSDPTIGFDTVMMSHSWFDLHPGPGFPTSAAETLAGQILQATMPIGCKPGDVDPTDVVITSETLPRVTRLYSNTPNPFNPYTTVKFDLAQSGHVEVKVFNISGRLIRTLVDEELKPKTHQVIWDGADNEGRTVASGVYFVRLNTHEVRAVQKAVVLR